MLVFMRLRLGWVQRIGWGVCLPCLAHCTPLEAPPALEGESFLCTEEQLPAFEAKLQECIDARAVDASACAGWMSFQGEVDGQFVVLDAPIQSVEYNRFHRLGQADLSISMTSAAPYYGVRFDMTAGLRVDQSDVQFGLTVSTYLNLEARGGNFLSNLQNHAFDIRYQTKEEVRTWVVGDLARGGFIELCYHAFLPPL